MDDRFSVIAQLTDEVSGPLQAIKAQARSVIDTQTAGSKAMVAQLASDMDRQLAMLKARKAEADRIFSSSDRARLTQTQSEISQMSRGGPAGGSADLTSGELRQIAQLEQQRNALIEKRAQAERVLGTEQNRQLNRLDHELTTRMKVTHELESFQAVLDKTIVSSAMNMEVAKEEYRARVDALKTLGATKEQMAALDAMNQRLLDKQKAMVDPLGRFSASRMHTAANAAQSLTYSLSGLRGGAEGAAHAVGNLSTSFAMMTRSGAVAAGATGIGLLAVAIGTIIGLMKQAREDAKPTADQLQVLGEVDPKLLESRIAYYGRMAQEQAQRAKGLKEEVSLMEMLKAAAVFATTKDTRMAEDIQAKRVALKDAEAERLRFAAMAQESDRLLADFRLKAAAAQVASDRELAHSQGIALASGRNEIALLEMKVAHTESFRMKKAELQVAYEAEMRSIAETYTRFNELTKAYEQYTNAQRVQAEAQAAQRRKLGEDQAFEQSVRAREDLQIRERLASAKGDANLQARIDERRLTLKREIQNLQAGSFEITLKERIAESEIADMIREEFNSRAELLRSWTEQSTRSQAEILTITVARIEAEAAEEKRLKPETAEQVERLRQMRIARVKADAARDEGSAMRGFSVDDGSRAVLDRQIQDVRDRQEILLAEYGSSESKRVAIVRSGEAQIADLKYQQSRRELSNLRGHLQGFQSLMKGHWKAGYEGAKNAADVVARIEMLMEAKKSAQLAVVAYGLAFKAFASGNVAGGAGHLLSAAQFTAAAAMGGAGAISAGSAGGRGDGGGSSITNPGEFSPRNTDQGAGNVTVNIITRDPYGRESIQSAIYEINRSGLMKRPIPIFPTNGVSVSAS